MNAGPSELEPSDAADRARALASELMADRESYIAFVRGRIRPGADAEDIFQQALVRATEHASALRDRSRTRPWFFRILRRTLADHHARWALREAKLATLAADLDEAAPEDVAVCGCSLGQLERIRPEYADILRRVDIDEAPVADVAGALGITVNNATVRLHRARRALRDQLMSFCGADSARACQSCSCDDEPIASTKA